MNRLTIARNFVNSYLKGETFSNNIQFVIRNGLFNFPNVDKKIYKKEIMLFAIRKKRLQLLLEKLLKNNRIQFLYYKGIALEKIYPNRNMRIYSDIDLLCSKNNFDKLKLPMEDFSKIYREKDLVIEIKYNFYDPYFYKFLSNKSKKLLIDIYKNNKNSLDDDYHFILLSIHNFQHQFNRLDRFFDLYFMLRYIDIKKVLDIAKKYEVDFFVRFNLFLMAQLGFALNINTTYYCLTNLEKILLINLFKTNKNRYKLMLLSLKLPLISGIYMIFEKMLFLDRFYINYLKRRWYNERKN